MRKILLSTLLLVAACGGPKSPFIRVTAKDGRVYYARQDRALHSPAGGFLTFRDLITREQVRLKNGSYVALGVPPQEVSIRQLEYLDDPSRVPQASDYEED